MKVSSKVFPLSQEEIAKQEGESKLVARASVYINNEFVINSVRLYDSGDKMFVSMPSEPSRGSEGYRDVVYPITADARKQIDNAVINAYKNPESEQAEAVTPVTESTTRFKLDLYPVGDGGTVLASGQLVLDDSIVVRGVKVLQGEKGINVAMPARRDKYDEWHDYANPITREAYDNIHSVAMDAYRKMPQLAGNAKYSELGAKNNITSIRGLDNEYAKAVMNRLNEAAIKHSAQVGETTTLSFNKSRIKEYRQISDETRKAFKEHLTEATAQVTEEAVVDEMDEDLEF